jgi:hypothetical protein
MEKTDTMEDRIARFVAALRAAGVRVSLAESEDAWHGMERLGVTNRDRFRWTLRATLIKEAKDIPVFEEMFPLYFGQEEQQPMQDPQAGMSPEDQQRMQDAMGRMSGDLRQLLEWLLSGQQPSGEQMQQLARAAGADRARSPQQARQYAQRMKRLLGWDYLKDVLEMLWEVLAQMGMDPEQIRQLQEQVAQNQGALENEIEQAAGQAISENMIEERYKQRPTPGDLMDRPFEQLSQEETGILREEIRRLAARLRSRASLRQKRGEEGKLDAKGTIRANLRYGGVPMELRFRHRRLKPRIVTFIDVSTSMRPVTDFFLRLLYELQDQVQKVRSFAYIDHIEEVSQDLNALAPDRAMSNILSRLPPGHYNTDFGLSLTQFRADHWDAVDSRTTVIVLGDARNNFNDPALNVLWDLRRRCRRLIWLNPEFPAQWGQGDSDMPAYAPLCNEVFQVRTLAQLTEAIDHMLAV